MKRITIEDVAQAADVSRQTVSRAINDKGEISQETKDRVMQAVRELGYRPNRLAQSMVTQRTYTVGLTIPDILNPFFPEVARGVQDVARDHDYNVFLCNTDDNPEVEIDVLRSLAAQRVDGIIALGSCIADETLTDFADTYRPIVITNRFTNHPHINPLIVDNIRGATLAAEHFVQQQHTAVGMLASDNVSFSFLRRVQGFRDALALHGLPYDDSIMEGGKPTISGGYGAMRRLLTRQPYITGIFAYNDLMALGALRACHDMGINVPEDISIIGFDDIHLTSIVTPSLTSIHVDKYAIGANAMTRLLAMLDQPDTIFPQQEMPVELVLRESTRTQF
ncbi:MAG: LacI family DNA-binding transcriptional regulator [Anaerolineales bacterium]|nr:LacI family DNA-binding transcriptional regulator [Anaerolineales bacterium]